MEQTNTITWLLFFTCIVGFAAGLIIGVGMGLSYRKKKKKQRKAQFPKCDCSDVNQCSKYCHAKYCFSQDFANGKI